MPRLVHSGAEEALDSTATYVLGKKPMPTEPQFDLKGHHIIFSPNHPFAYCSHCSVTRRASDWRYIGAKPCVGDAKLNAHLCEGDYHMKSRHLMRVMLAQWTTGERRLQSTCVKCHQAVDNKSQHSERGE